MEDRLNEAQKIIDDMSKAVDISKIEDLIKDNKIVFMHKEKEYRVRLLDRGEKEELDMLRRKKFGQLIQDKDILLEKDLRVQYKERGLNIDEIDEAIKKLSAQEVNLQMSLGEAITKNESETIFNNYKEQIEEIRIEKQTKSAQKTILLEFSLENQLLNYVAEIITYLSLDIKTDTGRWVRLFKTIEDFRVYDDNELINTAGVYTMLLQYL